MSAINEELKKRTTPRSIWDNVFARLFVDQEAWQTAKTDLQKTVIRCRHKVMHHRPMRVYEVNKLKEACVRIENALNAKARTIKDAERKEIRKTATELFDFAKYANMTLPTLPDFKLPTVPDIHIPTIDLPVPAGDLGALSRQLPDMTAFNSLVAQTSKLQGTLDALNRAARVSDSFRDYLRATDTLSEQLGRLSKPVFPWFESVPDELPDEPESPDAPEADNPKPQK